MPIKDKLGRESLEEFGVESRQGDSTYSDQALSIEESAEATYPSSSPAPRSTGPALDAESLPASAGLRDGTLSIDEFRFLECDLQLPGEEPEPCPVCRPNPYAYVPDYRMMGEGEVFFDGKNCTQNIVLTYSSPASTVDPGPSVSLMKNNSSWQRDQKERGIRLLLDYYNKSDIATAYIYEPQPPKSSPFNLIAGAAVGGPSGAAVGLGVVFGAAVGTIVDAMIPDQIPGYDLVAREIDNVEELLKYTEFTFHIPIQKAARTRVLISVPVEMFERVPEKLVTEPSSEFETNLEVTFVGKEFIPTLKRVSRAFRVYNGQLNRWRNFDGGSLVEVRSASEPGKKKPVLLDLKVEADSIKAFRKEIQDFVKQKDIGLSFSPVKPARIPEKITFKFEEKGEDKIRLRQIVLNKPGCPDIKIGPKGRFKALFESLTEKNVFKKTRTLYYIGTAPEIDIKLQARTPTPWLEVVTSYTYPPVEVFYGPNQNTIYNEPSLAACFGSAALGGESVDQFFNEMGGLLLGFPDAILEEFSKTSCHTREEMREKLRNLGTDDEERYKIAEKRFLEEAKRKIGVDDPYLEIVLEELITGAEWSKEIKQADSVMAAGDEYKKGEFKRQYREEMKDEGLNFWSRLNNRLGWCGWIALTMQAIDCVAQGLGEESSTKALAEAAFSSMDSNYLGKVFLGLSPEQQQSVIDSMEDEFSSVPAPWDRGYVGGNYSGPGFSIKDSEGPYRPIREPALIRGFAAGAGDNFISSEQSRGSGGTYGEALGSTQEAIIDAYKEAMLSAVGADVLLEQMNQLPGAPIVAQVFKNLPCAITPPFYSTPRMDNFLNTLDFEVCQWDIDLTLPNFQAAFPEFHDIFLRIAEALREAIIDTAIAMVMSAFKLILSKILSLACDAIASVGANLLDLFAGSDHFRSLLKENMCPDASNEDLYSSLRSIFSALGGPEASCLEQLTNSEMGEFIDDLSMMLTQGQILQLINGNPTEETMLLAIEVAKTSKSECISEVFSDPAAFGTFFPSLGIFLPNLDELNERLAPPSLLDPVYPCSPEDREKIDELRCQLLGQKGLSSEECREQLDDLKDRNIQDLKDLADMMQNGPFSDFPPMESTPGCPPDGFMSDDDPLAESFNEGITGLLFESIEKAHIRDLMGSIDPFTGHGGVLNAVLSDTKGRPFKKHQWMVRHFGSPLARDLGFFEWASDDAIRRGKMSEGADKIPMNIYGVDLKDKDGKGNSFFNYSDGGYPPTVGAHLRRQFLDLEPEFSTLNSPKGFSTMAEALEEYNRVLKVNERRIERRKDYIEAWIREFDLEEATGGKRSQAANDLRIGIERNIFTPGDPNKRPPHVKKNSPEDLAREVLLGKQILGGVGKKGGSEKWSERNRKKANTDGQTFVEYWDQGNKYSLLPLPDTSSADIRLDYKGYVEGKSKEGDLPGFEVSVQYDYNLFDEETSELKQENQYRLKVVETHRSPNGGKLKKKEIRKMGGEVPPESILGDGETIFTTYDLTVFSNNDEEVERKISTLPLSEEIEDSYQIETFYKHVSDVLISVSDNKIETITQSGFRDHFAKEAFNDISSGFLARISNLIATGDTGKNKKGKKDEDLSKREQEQNEEINLDNVANGFKFGYDPYKSPKIIELDPAIYGGPLGRIFPEKVPAPFYVQERRYEGWMDIASALVPEADGCEVASKPVFELDDLQSTIGNLSNELIEDERLQYDPLCSTEAPFDRILTSFSAANLEGVLRAIVRIYVLDVFIRGIPAFTAFGLNDDNYDSLLQSFVAERIRQGLYEDGARATGKTDDEYYYRVLEQATNNTVRMIDSGIIDPDLDMTEEEIEALNTIKEVVRSFYRENEGELAALSDAAIKGQAVLKRIFSTPDSSKVAGIGAGSSKFSKAAAKNMKEAAFIETVGEAQDAAAVFLRRYIKEEFDTIKDKFVATLPPLVTNIHHLFLINGDWIKGAVYDGGPYDVMSNPRDPMTYNIEALGEGQYWPFVLEKYIKIEDKASPPSSVASRSENLYNVVNIQDWADFVKLKKSEGLAGDISEFWGNPLVRGETTKIKEHSHTYQIDDMGNGVTSISIDDAGVEHVHTIVGGEIQRAEGHTHEIPITGWKFGLRLSYQPKPNDNPVFEKVLQMINPDTSMREKAFTVGSPSGTRYLIPIATAELAIPDQEFTLFEPESYDVFCLIEELVNTPEYKMMFKYVFPLQRFTSLLAIYCVMSFFDSIGNAGFPEEGGDMWEVAGGRGGRKFRKWERGPQAFRKSRQAAKAVFTSFYESSQAYDFDSSNKNDPRGGPASLREMLRPKVNFEDGLRWWQRGRRVKGRPFNSDGEECP